MSSPSGSNVSYTPDRSKFKDSCDSCAQAKVKCSRVRPNCQRCVRSGIVCHYSLARRGKAASVAIVSGQANPPKSPAPKGQRHSVTTATEDFCSQAPDLTSIDGEFSLSADFISSPASEVHQMAGIPHDIHLTPHESSLDFSLLSRLGNSDSNTRGIAIPTMTAIDRDLLALSTDPTDSQLGNKPFFGSDGMGDTHAPDSSANIRVVLSTLESLHVASTLSAPGIDMILKINSMAIGNLSALLKDPFGLNSSNMTLLALVCCNSIIDAYQQILLVQRNPAKADHERSNSEDPMDCYFATAAIATDMPIAVGAFLLDSSAKQKIISSVILSELTRIGNIVERIMPSGKSGVPQASRSIKVGGEFVSTLKPLLKEKLRAIIRTVKADMIESDDM